MDSLELATVALTVMILVRVVCAIVGDDRRIGWLTVALLWALVIIVGVAGANA